MPREKLIGQLQYPSLPTYVPFSRQAGVSQSLVAGYLFFEFVILENITLVIFFLMLLLLFIFKISYKENSTVFLLREYTTNRIKIGDFFLRKT